MLIDKIILITGASRGIGKSIAQVFAAHGARLILTGRDKNSLDKLISNIHPHPDAHLSYIMDVQDYASIKDLFDTLFAQKIFIDVLVNNAGIMHDSILQMVKPSIIQETYNTNVFGTIYASQFALKSFLRKKSGSIINLSSIIGTNGNSGQSIYGSSKSAVIGFTKSLSKEVSRLNIRVNAIAPGYIDTDLNSKSNIGIYEKTINSIGMQRMGKPNEIANVALFLASDLSSYVTGQIIGVDGGMII
jgi:3-oxoacyl-[acyl-carrier protein] reductase